VQIAIPLYDGVDALDAVGPYGVLSRLPGAEITFVAAERGPKRDARGLALVADRALSELSRPDVIVVPGGRGSRTSAGEEIVEWIRTAHASTRWTTSVCTGSLLLGAAGVLDGLRATSHWLHLDRLRELGAEPTSERVVREGKVITAAGVSSGIDMALTLAALEAGDDVAQAIQLAIEYDPQPPFDAGSPSKAPGHVVERVRAAAARNAVECPASATG
jgi:transcriptional regulator GlxA family with amidase domain